MNTPSGDSKRRKRHRLGVILTIVFATALILGTGPGILLVNQPKPILGLPAIYTWGLLWYVVEVGVVLTAALFVWKDDEPDS